MALDELGAIVLLEVCDVVILDELGVMVPLEA